jgi:hypothetical protein
MKKSRSIQRSLASILGNFALVILGVGIALVLTELFLRRFPNWVPREIRVDPPVRRVQADVDETYDLRASDGDLFTLDKEAIAPLSPEKDEVLAHVHMTTDENGFRNLLPEHATYGIVALGDSFTRGTGVATAWPQKLAQSAGIAVLNLGDVGIGPQQEQLILQKFGLEKRPKWVVLAYFEGNDLYDAAAYDLATPFIVSRLGKYLLTQGEEAWRASGMGNGHAAMAPRYHYPITIRVNDINLTIAFFPGYIAWLSVSREAIKSSNNYRLATEAILKMRELTEAEGARFLFVYVPSKEHIYLPFLNDAEALADVFSDVPKLELDDAENLQFTNHTATPELTWQLMDDQEQLLTDFAAEKNIAFLDLTPDFKEEAGTGAELYYPFDTHWNQNGNNLAAQTIAKYVAVHSIGETGQ